MDEVLYAQIGTAFHLQALVLIVNIYYPRICWRDNKAVHKQSRSFLDCTGENFILQMIEELFERGAPLDLVFTNKEGLARNVKLKGNLGHCGHEMMEFTILRTVGRAPSKLTNLDFRREHSSLFRGLLSKIPQDKAIKGSWATDTNWNTKSSI